MNDDLGKALFLFDEMPNGLWKCGACGEEFSKDQYAAHVLTHHSAATPSEKS